MEQNTVAVSVAIGTYNGARYVVEQLESILRQTVSVDEIVVSDDNSNDNTLELVRESFARVVAETGQQTTLIVLTNTPGLGVTKNFERAVLAASGDVIILSDQDDLWHSTKVERLVAALAPATGEAPLLVFTNARLVDARGASLGMSLFDAIEISPRERKDVAEGRAFEVFLRRNIATGATMAFRRELLSLTAPFPVEWVHDEWLATIASAVGRVELLDDQLVDYRQHGSNEIGATAQSFSQKVKKLFAPRRKRNARLIGRARTLVPALRSLPGISQQASAAAEQKLEHETVRSSLPAARLRRIRPIWRELKTGRYDLYDYGKKDAARDFLQPDR